MYMFMFSFGASIMCGAQSGFNVLSILHSTCRAAKFALLIVMNGQWANLLPPTSLLVMMELFLCNINKEMAKGITCSEPT